MYDKSVLQILKHYTQAAPSYSLFIAFSFRDQVKQQTVLGNSVFKIILVPGYRRMKNGQQLRHLKKEGTTKRNSKRMHISNTLDNQQTSHKMKSSSRNSFLGKLFVILLMTFFLFAVILWWLAAPPPSYTSMPTAIPLSESESLSSWPETKQQEQQQDHQQQHQNLVVVHKAQEHNNFPLLDCKDMEQIKIIRRIGEGKMKKVYKVILPLGLAVLAKRCISIKYVRKGILEAEARHIVNLQKVHGRENTIHYYGECNAKRAPHFEDRMKRLQHIKENAADFRVSFTWISEIGKPLITGWHQSTT